MTEPILCATDFATGADSALHHAVELAKATQRPLRLLHVSAALPEEVPGDGPAQVYYERIMTRREAAKRDLTRAREEAARDIDDCEIELLHGRPWEVLVDHATSVDASLLVVGRHGEGGALHANRAGILERILGTTADRVIRHAPCPVLVAAAADRAHTPLGHGKWLVACDFSHPAQHALEVVNAMRGPLDATLHGLYVRETARGVDDADVAQKLVEGRVEETLGPDAEVELSVVDGVAFAEIDRSAEALDASLIVLGSHGRTGPSRVLLGSTAERVIRRTHRPVLVVPFKQ